MPFLSRNVRRVVLCIVNEDVPSQPWRTTAKRLCEEDTCLSEDGRDGAKNVHCKKKVRALVQPCLKQSLIGIVLVVTCITKWNYHSCFVAFSVILLCYNAFLLPLSLSLPTSSFLSHENV